MTICVRHLVVFALFLLGAGLRPCSSELIEFGEPKVPWNERYVKCPTLTETWVNSRDGEELKTKLYCIGDPSDSSRDRCYFLFIPDCAQANAPLVVNPTGYSSCPETIEETIRWGSVAKEECFVVAYPYGFTDFDVVDSHCWQLDGGLKLGLFAKATPTCCCSNVYFGVKLPVLESKTKDREFMRNMIKDAVEQVKEESGGSVTIDTKRIYMAGLSNGAIFGIGFSLTNSDLIAAFAGHAFILNIGPSEDYQAIPIWMAHGTSDLSVPIEPTDFTGTGLYSTLGKEMELEYLGDLNGCDTEVLIDNTSFGAEATLMSRTGCANDADVQLLFLEKAGHFISGPNDEVDSAAGVVPTTINTTKVAWDFISRYSKDAEPDLSKDVEQSISYQDPVLISAELLGTVLGLVERTFSFFGGIFSIFVGG